MEELYTLAKIWAEWQSRCWIGMRSATVMEVAEFLDSLCDAGMNADCRTCHDMEADAEAIREGWETEEKAVSHEIETSIYEISIVLQDEYPRRESIRIATISFFYRPRSIRGEAVTVYEIDRSISVDATRTIHFAGGDGDEREWYQIPSSPCLYTQNWKSFFLEMPEIELHFDEINTDGAFLLRNTKRAKPAEFDIHYEDLF